MKIQFSGAVAPQACAPMKRALSLFLAVILAVSMFGGITASASAPTSLRVGTIFTDETYTSGALGGSVSIRDIPVTFNDSSESYGFCYQHGANLTAHTTGYRWISDGTTLSASSTAAAPFLATFYYNLAKGEWSDWETATVSSWVQVALWLSQEGVFNDYNDRDQLDILAAERRGVLSLYGIDMSIEASMTLFYQIIESYESGMYGTLTAQVYYFDDVSAGMQPVFVGSLSSTVDFYPVYVKLSKTLDGAGYLAGATFGVYTDAACTILLDNLGAGWYRVTELAPPSGYLMGNPSVQDIFLAGGNNKMLYFENTPKSAIVIRKIDSDTGLPV